MIGLIIIGVLVFIVMGMYNTLIGKKNQVENVFGSLDASLKKRHDLVPNLVASVQTYMGHEAGTLKELTALRAQATSGQLSTDEKVVLDNKISKAIGGIMVAVENYPDLKASQNFMQLQRSLNEIEEQISAGRRSFNAAVTDYNNAIEMFPTSLLAGPMGMARKHVFEATEAERTNPNVGDLFNQ